MRNKVIFYSSVKSKELFHIQRFYHIDIELIKRLGYCVYESNRIFDFLCFWKYNIAFIYFYKFGLFPAIMARFFLKKIYFTGGIDSLEESISVGKDYVLQKIFFKLCYLLSNNCILVSKSDENNVRKIYNGKLPKRACLSFHTIEVERFVNAELSKKQNIFLTIAWMESVGNVYRKGIDKALIVFKYLTEKKEYSEAKFYLIGKEGEGSDYLRKLCVDLKISEKVIFTGSIDEELKIEMLKLSKYYFQLSTYEGFGIAAIEALAAKNIVIHSGNGALSETINDYGIMVDIESDIDQLVNYIYEQLSNYNYKQLDIAQKHVQDNYSNIRRQKDFEKIFKN